MSTDIDKKAKVALIEELHNEFITVACAIAMAQSMKEVKAICMARDTPEEIVDEIFQEHYGVVDNIIGMVQLLYTKFPTTRQEAAEILREGGIMPDYLDRYEEQTRMVIDILSS